MLPLGRFVPAQGHAVWGTIGVRSLWGCVTPRVLALSTLPSLLMTNEGWDKNLKMWVLSVEVMFPIDKIKSAVWRAYMSLFRLLGCAPVSTFQFPGWETRWVYFNIINKTKLDQRIDRFIGHTHTRFCLLNFHVEILKPGGSEVDLIWRQVFQNSFFIINLY